MTRLIRFILVGFALTGLGTQVHAQANDVECTRCVDAADIAGKAINASKIKKFAVHADKIKPGAVTSDKLSPDLSDAIQGSRNPLVLDGADNEIGQLVSIGENHWGIEVITEQGYLVTLSPRDGEISDGALYFATADCTGTGYINGEFFGGYVARVVDGQGPAMYYVDKDSLPVTDFSYSSLIFDGACQGQSGQQLVFPVLPNNPSITGVSTDTYPLPIKIDRPQ